MANALQIVTPWLLFALMGGNRCISSSSSQILTVFVGNVFSRAIHVALCETEVDYVHSVSIWFLRANEEVIRLNISVDYAFSVDFLEMLHKLNCDQKHGFDVELTFAGLEQIFKRRSKQVHNHHVHVQVGNWVIGTDVVQQWNASYSEIVCYRRISQYLPLLFILWISLDSQNNMGFFWCLVAFSYNSNYD